jgi:hypothetical protein
MGSSESSRWRGYKPQPLVEHTPRLDFNSQSWRAVLKLPTASGEMIRTDSISGACTAKIAFELGPIEENFERTLVLSPQHSQDRLSVTLEARQVGFDRRWHARCPLDCGRSARSLFLTPDGQLGCRSCLGLVYLSSRKSDARVDLARLNPQAFLEGRAHLRGLRSRIVTAWLFEEAQRRGRLRLTPRRLRRVLLDGAAPEVRELVEQCPTQNWVA